MFKGNKQLKMEKIATREAYGNALAKFGENKDVVALDADLSCSTKSNVFGKKYPERFFNLGISEQDLVGTAAGLAISGKIPFASTFAVFITGRAYDQIRVSVAYPNVNVRLVGSHAGLMTGEDGVTHQALEDIALMRSLPNMTVIQPADAVETEKAVEFLLNHKGPVYLRTSRSGVPVIFDENYKFEIGKGVLLNEGNDITIIATGSLVHEAIEAVKALEKNNISARLINIHTTKPIDKEIIIKAAKETKVIVSCEDHSIIGGLGSAISEVLSQEQPCVMEMVGVKDKFGESGPPAELYKKYGLTSGHIADAAEKAIRRKNE